MADIPFEEIRHGDELLAIIIGGAYRSAQTRFFSPPGFSQQVGYLAHARGHTIEAHFHRQIQREIIFTQEVLLIRRGRLRVNFYDERRKFVTARELTAGDTLFLCSGGHGFKILEDTEMIEVKQGPYSGRGSDKENFIGVEDDPGQ